MFTFGNGLASLYLIYFTVIVILLFYTVLNLKIYIESRICVLSCFNIDFSLIFIFYYFNKNY